MSECNVVYTEEYILRWLQEDLGRRNPADTTVEFLRTLVASARIAISAEGVTIPDEITDIQDALLIEMYAAYLYRKRGATSAETAMPRYLRYLLNNRVFGNRGE